MPESKDPPTRGTVVKEEFLWRTPRGRCIKRKQTQRSFDSAGRFASDSSGCTQDDMRIEIGETAVPTEFV